MKPAQEVQWFVNGSLAFWQAYDPASKVDLSCVAVRLGNRLIFIDPIPLVPDALAELTASATPAAVVLTSGNHERAGAAFAAQFGVPVLASAEAVPEFTLKPDGVLADGDFVVDALRVFALPGGAQGEMALYWSENGGVLCFGDALIHLESTGLCLLPDKYCQNAKELKRSLKKLLGLPVGTMTFAHGLPIVSGAIERLSALVS